MKRILWLATLVVAAALVAVWRWTVSTAPPPAAPALAVAKVLALQESPEGFARAFAPRPFVFPRDHGPHPDFRTEWWYYTGNVATRTGRRFGFQLTFFRNALVANPPRRGSAWAARDIYLAHFAITDVQGRQILAAERWERGALGLAGAESAPFHVWVGPWSASAQRAAAGETPVMQLQASAATRRGAIEIDLSLDPAMPPVPEGRDGLSSKSSEPGNASYYYSIPRLGVRGTLRIGAESEAVTGSAWLDREWSTSALGPSEVGWDWLGLQLGDGRALMLYRLRHRDGTIDPASAGTLISGRGEPRPLTSRDFQLKPVGEWQSPTTGARYPARWRISIPSAALELDVEPLLANQELDLAFRYWEGAVTLQGTAAGRPLDGVGYLEMTGYDDRAAAAR
jgi:predicted secreted hydrolase